MANPASETCTTCGQRFTTAQMEITGDGYRCFRCAQTAAIAQHEVDRAAQIRGHNRTVMAMGGFKFWNLEFHCSQCSEKIDNAPGLFSLSLPPRAISCPKCGASYAPTFWHRTRWLSSLLLKVAFPIVVAVRHQDLRGAIATGSGTTIAASLVLSFGIALGAGIVLAIPAALATGGGKQPPA